MVRINPRYYHPIEIIFGYDAQSSSAKSLCYECYDRIIPSASPKRNTSLEYPLVILNSPKVLTEKIATSTAREILLFLFADNEMILNQSWHTELVNITNNPRIKPVMIAMVERAFVSFPEINDYNGIRTYEFLSQGVKKTIFLISHRICLSIYSQVVSSRDDPIMITIFLSHSTRDGLSIARKIRNYLADGTPLRTFMAENNIEHGQKFVEVINQNIDKSVMLAIQTDSYSSSEYCKNEILRAKSSGRVIIALSSLEEGEERSFPYLGNTRTVRYKRNIDYYTLLFEITLEVSRRYYFQLETRGVFELLQINPSVVSVYKYPPELISVAYDQNSPKKSIVYPDPPLSIEEAKLLHSMSKKRFYTPIQFFLEKTKLSSIISGQSFMLSCSIPQNPGYDNAEQDMWRFVFFFSRLLFSLGTKLIFSGSLKFAGSNILLQLANVHEAYSSSTRGTPSRLIENYYYDDHDIALNQSLQVQVNPYISFIRVPEPSMLDAIKVSQEEHNLYRLFNLRSYVASRSIASILVGGRSQGFSGIMPGVLHEFLVQIETGKPIFLLGGYGGVTEIIVKVLCGDESRASLKDLIKPARVSMLRDTLIRLNENDNAITRYINLLSSFSFDSLHNGLTKNENILLCHTTNAYQSIALISKGLSRLLMED